MQQALNSSHIVILMNRHCQWRSEGGPSGHGPPLAISRDFSWQFYGKILAQTPKAAQYSHYYLCFAQKKGKHSLF